MNQVEPPTLDMCTTPVSAGVKGFEMRNNRLVYPLSPHSTFESQCVQEDRCTSACPRTKSPHHRPTNRPPTDREGTSSFASLA
jgi:hypothetical protein